ncbi:hypothetical protein [Novosphingobium huizhouense]|uniref:hypothetical protein n=1 Tax=Novosphingobium huizhouense TaxID=2866625 RepID=UPI001CD884F0|nr:hypothetical protein [Novosphingobium huizhouense]
MSPSPIAAPAGYATPNAVAYADVDGNAAIVSKAQPLPVQLKPAPVSPLAGTTTTSVIVGPYVPAVDRPIILSLNGTWTGLVKVSRSTDGGATRLPLTLAGTAWAQFSANACEPIWEEPEAGATLYLEVTMTSGTLIYRLAQ